MADWSNGCVQDTPLVCQNGDGFLKYSHIKLPDTQNSWINETISIKECGMICLNNCSCRGGSGFLLWFGDLIDIREFPEGGQDIYIRVASSELGGSKGKKRDQLNINAPARPEPNIVLEEKEEEEEAAKGRNVET